MKNADPQIIELRHQLHAHPDLADHEEETAGRIRNFLERYSPDSFVEELGGHGLAAVYEGAEKGPSVLVRCDLDALPIHEDLDASYRSGRPGVAHKCGHDGHMSMVSGLAPLLHAEPPARGRVILLYQPAEETGQGAARVIEDPKFDAIRPDYAFALHNLPGFPLGTVVLRDGFFASASSGFIARLQGETSHAGEPQQGKSPALAVADLIQTLSAVPQFHTALHEAAQVTIIHAQVGERAFGTSPGMGAVMATLRAHSQDVLDRLSQLCRALAEKIASAYDLKVSSEMTEEFPSTVNNPDCVRMVEDAAKKAGCQISRPEIPFAWSEDFGHFTRRTPGALFGLGSGVGQPALHHPDYDFPDALLPVGTSVFDALIRTLVGSAAG
jgi:amidohydrolase